MEYEGTIYDEHARTGRKAPLKANPYTVDGKWYWHDDNGKYYGPYPTQMDALYALLHHMNPPWWKRWWDNLKAFWNDTRGTS